MKRWCDRGVIRTDKTLGGHRRIPLEHLLEFLESTNRRIIDPTAIGLNATRQLGRDELTRLTEDRDAGMGSDPDSDTALREQFQRALLAGDESHCRKAISSWYTIHGGMASVADDLLAPTLHSVGELWACGRAEV